MVAPISFTGGQQGQTPPRSQLGCYPTSSSAAGSSVNQNERKQSSISIGGASGYNGPQNFVLPGYGYVTFVELQERRNLRLS